MDADNDHCQHSPFWGGLFPNGGRRQVLGSSMSEQRHSNQDEVGQCYDLHLWLDRDLEGVSRPSERQPFNVKYFENLSNAGIENDSAYSSYGVNSTKAHVKKPSTSGHVGNDLETSYDLDSTYGGPISCFGSSDKPSRCKREQLSMEDVKERNEPGSSYAGPKPPYRPAQDTVLLGAWTREHNSSKFEITQDTDPNSLLTPFPSNQQIQIGFDLVRHWMACDYCSNAEESCRAELLACRICRLNGTLCVNPATRNHGHGEIPADVPEPSLSKIRSIQEEDCVKQSNSDFGSETAQAKFGTPSLRAIESGVQSSWSTHESLSSTKPLIMLSTDPKPTDFEISNDTNSRHEGFDSKDETVESETAFEIESNSSTCSSSFITSLDDISCASEDGSSAGSSSQDPFHIQHSDPECISGRLIFVIDQYLTSLCSFETDSSDHVRTCTAETNETHARDSGVNCNARRDLANSQGKRSRKHLDENADDDNPDDNPNENPRKRPRKLTKETGDDEKRGFACFFYKNKTWKFNGNVDMTYNSCPRGSWNLKGLKEHCKRCHTAPIYCPRCKTLFDTEELLYEHVLRAEGCEVNYEVVIDGVTKKHYEDWATAVKRKDEPEEKWRKMYKILFPGENIPSPYTEYFDTSSSSDSQMVESFRIYLDNDLPAAVERIVEQYPQPTSAQLQSEVVLILRDVINGIHAHFQRMRLSAHTGMGLVAEEIGLRSLYSAEDILRDLLPTSTPGLTLDSGQGTIIDDTISLEPQNEVQTLPTATLDDPGEADGSHDHVLAPGQQASAPVDMDLTVTGLEIDSHQHTVAMAGSTCSEEDNRNQQEAQPTGDDSFHDLDPDFISDSFQDHWNSSINQEFLDNFNDDFTLSNHDSTLYSQMMEPATLNEQFGGDLFINGKTALFNTDNNRETGDVKNSSIMPLFRRR